MSSLEHLNCILAHRAGQSFVAHCNQSDVVVSCGFDGELKFWSRSLDDPEPDHSLTVSESCTALDVMEGRVYIGTDRSTVVSYDMVTLRRIETFATFRLPPTSITHTSSEEVIVASADFEIRSINVKDKLKVKHFLGHMAPILSITVSASGKSLCSCSCDGSVRFWSIESALAIRSFDILPKSNDIGQSKVLAKASFGLLNDDLELLLVPCEQSLTIIVADESGKPNIDREILLENPSEAPPQGVVFSKFLKLFAISFSNGNIGIFNTDFKRSNTDFAVKGRARQVVCSMFITDDFKSDLFFITKTGNMGLIKGDVLRQSKTNLRSGNNTTAVFSDDDDDDDDTIVEFEHQSESVVKKNSLLFFQCCSTPTYHAQSILVWNKIGIVVRYESSDDHMILVEFHNTLHHHNVSLNNTIDQFDKAALNSQALLLAQGQRAKCLIYRGIWSGSEWSVEVTNIAGICLSETKVFILTNSSEIRILNLSGLPICDCICVAGSPVTVCTGTSPELAVFYEQNQSLRCAQFNFNAQGSIGVCPQCVSDASIPMDIHHRRMIWAGFGEKSANDQSRSDRLYYIDSEHNLRIIRMSQLNGCVVVSFIQNLKNSKSCTSSVKNVWPISVQEYSMAILCAQCRLDYPEVITPRPDPIRIFLKVETFDGNEEIATLITHEIYSEHLLEPFKGESDVQFQNCLLKAFHLACQQNQEMRAVVLAKLMSGRNLRSALKFADKLNKRRIMNEINESLTAVEEEPEKIEQKQSRIVEPKKPTEPPLTAFPRSEIIKDSPAKCPFKTAKICSTNSSTTIFSKLSGDSMRTPRKSLKQTSILNSISADDVQLKKRSAFDLFFEQEGSKFESRSEAIAAFLRLSGNDKKAYLDQSTSEPMDCE